MSTRRHYLQRQLRQIYGGFPKDDAEITINLINSWLNDAIAAAAQLNYRDSIKLDGVAYINNSFYTTYKNISFTKESAFLFKAQLPQVPVGLGRNEGVHTLQFLMPDGGYSQTAIPLSQYQVGYNFSMKPIPNKIMYWYEGDDLFVQSTLPLNTYTAKTTMVSPGNPEDLDSVINVPEDYFDFITQYLIRNLSIQRGQPVDAQNDGADFVKTT